MRKRTSVLIYSLLFLFSAVFAWGLVMRYFMHKALSKMTQQTAVVTATKVKLTQWQPYLQATGSLLAEQSVDITSQQPGQITQIDFESGQAVKQGQILLQLDHAVDDANLNSAQAQLALDKGNYERAKKLMPSKSISVVDFEQIKSQYEQALATVEKMRALLKQETITAPFSGKVGIKKINVGQFIQPGAVIAHLENTRNLLLHFTIPAQDINQVHINQAITVSVANASQQQFHGRVFAIDPGVDADTRSILIEAKVPNIESKLWPGSFALVKIKLPLKKSVIIIPKTALTYSMYGDYVYVVTHDKSVSRAKQELVQTGPFSQMGVIITSGLKEGDVIITSGQNKIHNGQAVKIDNSAALLETQNGAK